MPGRFTRSMRTGVTSAGRRQVPADRRHALVSPARSLLVAGGIIVGYFVLPMSRLDGGSLLRLAVGLALIAALVLHDHGLRHGGVRRHRRDVGDGAGGGDRADAGRPRPGRAGGACRRQRGPRRPGAAGAPAMTATASTTARTASGAVLLTLASAQFLMTLDSSVMNVSIATVAQDVGTTVTGIQTAITLYTLVMASLMITGGKIGQILGRQAGLHPGLPDLRRRLVHHLGRAEPHLAADRLVAPRGDRRRPDHARDRGPGGVELRPARPAARLRPGGGRGCDRGGGRPADRRPAHDLRLLALGLRRRGGRGAGHRDAGPEAERRAARTPPPGSTWSGRCCPPPASAWRSSASCAPASGGS